MPYYTPYNFQPTYMPQAYQPPTPQVQAQVQPQQQPTSGINWVAGEKEAMLYPVAPNTAIALWDSNSPCIYLKQADASGKPSVKVYDIVERVTTTETAQVSEYATKQEVGSVAESIASLKSEIASIKTDLYGLAGKAKKESDE